MRRIVLKTKITNTDDNENTSVNDSTNAVRMIILKQIQVLKFQENPTAVFLAPGPKNMSVAG